MELFIFILSFITGVAFVTVLYNAYIISTIRSRYNTVLDYQHKIEDIQQKQFVETTNAFNTFLKEMNGLRNDMASDNYQTLLDMSDQLESLQSSMSSINMELDTMKKINKKEVEGLHNKMQTVTKRLVELEESPQSLNSKY